MLACQIRGWKKLIGISRGVLDVRPHDVIVNAKDDFIVANKTYLITGLVFIGNSKKIKLKLKEVEITVVV